MSFPALNGRWLPQPATHLQLGSLNLANVLDQMLNNGQYTLNEANTIS